MHLKFRDADRHDLRVLLGSCYTLVDPTQPLDPLLQRRKRGRAAGAAGRLGPVHLLWPDPGGESGREARPGVVFRAYCAQNRRFRPVFAAYCASYSPLIAPKLTYSTVYCAKPATPTVLG